MLCGCISGVVSTFHGLSRGMAMFEVAISDLRASLSLARPPPRDLHGRPGCTSTARS